MEDPVKQDLNALIKKYDEFIARTLKPSLKQELDERDLIFNSISEYQKLNLQIETIEENDLKELKTMVDLGSQFYVQAHIPDTRYIYVNVGFGFHVQFTLDEAKAYIVKKEAHLQRLADKHTVEADKIRAHIKMALEAMSEIIMMEVVLDYGNKAYKKVEPAVQVVSPYLDSFSNEMQPILNRPVDWILFLYFLTHIPITIFFDLQCLYPKSIIPTFLAQLNGTYMALTNDPFMDTNRPTMYWFKSFALCEAFLQLPFFFFATYGVFKDKPWVRLPLVIYGAHVMTTVLPCLAEIIFNQELYGIDDFQRKVILFLYTPYFLIPLIGLADASIRITKRLAFIDAHLAIKKDT
ncbi:hypothetical protein INT47_003299 [Mucor saturninus]|uniref:EXPERA domain-containing protein n=1 Tax=Mucor saturninus TaxID=64648 RepID=A0A8H7RF66_9FUNG|nr:hypothetical protein INT47_003299 [Mucor saturninus]